MSRFVIIDDTNPSIQYSGHWFEAVNTQLETGDEGPPFQNTLHGVNGTGVTVISTISFSFSGSAVIVYGTSNTLNTSGPQDPTWECLSTIPASIRLRPAVWYWAEVKTTGSFVGLARARTSYKMMGPVNASVTNQTFWFDQIQYIPSDDISLSESLLRIDASDSAIQYSSGWQFVDNPINYQSTAANQFGNYSYTQTNGAKLTYEFSGTSISSFGLVSLATASDPIASAAYTIDDQAPITFPVGNSSTQDLFNQMSFQTGQLSPGQHKLVITYLGNLSTQPITINYFVQQDSDVPSGSSSPGKPTGAIVGGVIGGVVLISLLIALFFFRRRRIIRRSNVMGDGR